jgi:hypothetical protein
LRGGSWNDDRDNARARVRNRNNPDNSNNNMGFRVCSSHGLWIRPEMLRGKRHGAEATGEVIRLCLPKERRDLFLAGDGLGIDNVTGRI